ncbi:MAG: IS4 family transposase, partial [Bdellovibrionales bacterium]
MTCCGRGRPSLNNIPNFDSSFQSKHLTKAFSDKEQRQRKFSPLSFFHTIIELISGTNREGYHHALIRTFGRPSLAPCKAALCKFRMKISFLFFKDILDHLLFDYESKRLTYQGLKIYAVDGWQVHLPRTDDIVNSGYNGRSVSKYRESYLPRMYLVHAYDALSGVTKDLREAPYLDEQHGAKNMVKNFERNSLTLYDRLYISTGMILAHKKAGNYFLMRARRNSFTEVRKFYRSKKQKASCVIEGVVIQMFKIENPKTGAVDVYITNLPKMRWLTPDVVRRLYRLRWEVENSFRDLAETMKLQQWHSKTINGIRQELYATFWLMNFVKIQMNKCEKRSKVVLSDVYLKPNFKLAINFVKSRFSKIIHKSRGVLKELIVVLDMSTEKREHESRKYRRELKSPESPYP